ncbi:MAG: gamma-glutamylcyclotransferase [Lautropia sp.]
MDASSSKQILTRELIASDSLRQAFGAGGVVPWTLERIEASLDAILPRVLTAEGAWVFGYGSLIWNPCIHVAESVVATVYGRHRALALKSTFGRGTRERPGLMLSLSPGGSCRGLMLRVDPRHARDELLLLWRREMIAGSYTPRVLSVRVAGRHRPAIVFDANPAHPNYCPPMPLEDAARMIAAARGFNGPNADYMHLTLAALAAHGIRDRMLERLCRLLLEDRQPR